MYPRDYTLSRKRKSNHFWDDLKFYVVKIKSKNSPFLMSFLVSVGLLLSTVVNAQTTVDDYVTIGLENNQEYVKQQLDTKIADEEKNFSKSLFLPNITFDASYLLAGGGRLIEIPAGDLVNPTNAAINQLAGNNILPTNIQNVNEPLLTNDFHDTKISIVQPILNTDIYYGYKARQAQLNVSIAKEEAYKNKLEFEIRKGYYNYIKVLDQKRILDSTRLVVKELVRVNTKFVKYDIATKDVLYNAESQLYQIDAQIASATKQLNTSRNFFNYLLNRDLNAVIDVDETLLSETNVYAVADLEEKAIVNRSEISQVEGGLEAQDFELKRNQNYLVPDISVAGFVGYQGFGYTFDEDQDYYLISFNLSWPIFQGGGNKAKIRKASLEKERLEAEFADLKNRIKLEVSSAVYDYDEAIAVHRARLSELTVSQENFAIISKKYQINQVLLVEFNEARTSYTTAQLSESIARNNIKIAEANIKRVTQYQ